MACTLCPCRRPAAARSAAAATQPAGRLLVLLAGQQPQAGPCAALRCCPTPPASRPPACLRLPSRQPRSNGTAPVATAPRCATTMPPARSIPWLSSWAPSLPTAPTSSGVLAACAVTVFFWGGGGGHTRGWGGRVGGKEREFHAVVCVLGWVLCLGCAASAQLPAPHAAPLSAFNNILPHASPPLRQLC